MAKRLRSAIACGPEGSADSGLVLRRAIHSANERTKLSRMRHPLGVWAFQSIQAALRMPANEALHDIQLLERIAAVRPYIVGVILTCPLLKVVECILVQHRANRSDLPWERKSRNRSRSLLGLATSTNSGYDVALVRLAGDGGLQGSRELTSPRSVRDSGPALPPILRITPL
jgi:hypothetical protein